MRVAMIGSGYVGLVSGACFADFGHVVTCVDKDPARISRLLKGEIPIFEPGLDDLVASNVREKRLLFTTDIRSAVADAEAVFIAVGTPPRNGDGHADLTYVYAAAREIADALAPGSFTVVVTNRRCRWALATRSSASSAKRARMSPSLWRLTPNFCAKARRSTTSSGRIVS